MNTLEFINDCPECSPICLRDFWAGDPEKKVLNIYDVEGSCFKSLALNEYDFVTVGGQTFKVKSVQETVMFGNVYYVYNVDGQVPSTAISSINNTGTAVFAQQAGKIWESNGRWYYTGRLPFELNWGFVTSSPAWSQMIGE